VVDRPVELEGVEDVDVEGENRRADMKERVRLTVGTIEPGEILVGEGRLREIEGLRGG
jgi:hypothetical protein